MYLNRLLLLLRQRGLRQGRAHLPAAEIPFSRMKYSQATSPRLLLQTLLQLQSLRHYHFLKVTLASFLLWSLPVGSLLFFLLLQMPSREDQTLIPRP